MSLETKIEQTEKSLEILGSSCNQVLGREKLVRFFTLRLFPKAKDQYAASLEPYIFNSRDYLRALKYSVRGGKASETLRETYSAALNSHHERGYLTPRSGLGLLSVAVPTAFYTLTFLSLNDGFVQKSLLFGVLAVGSHVWDIKFRKGVRERFFRSLYEIKSFDDEVWDSAVMNLAIRYDGLVT